MKQGFFKSVRNFFGQPSTPPKPIHKEKQHPKSSGPRIVTFGGNYQSSQYKQIKQDEPDTRYPKVEVRETWKDMGIQKDEIVEGEIPIFVQRKCVHSKNLSGQYMEITLILSDYQIFIKKGGQSLSFPLGKIQKLHKYTNKQNYYKLLIGLKDGRSFKLRINTESMCKTIYNYIEKFAFVRFKQQFFAFKHYQFNKSVEQIYRGWQTYDLVKEFLRMGVKLMPHSQNITINYWSDYKIVDNRDGRICPSYPQKIVLPSRIPYDCVVRCSKFRSRSRMPALSYLHQWKNQVFSGLYRSSQSKVGVSNSRSPEDEFVLKLIGDPKFDPKKNSVQQTNCVIFDARNKLAAFGHKVVGKGYQSQQFYPNCKVSFLNIANIHAVRDSYNKVLKASQGEDSKFYSAIAQSQWYDFIFIILEGATQVARSLINGQNVLVHCSDGWDRTSQLCSLAAIFLDPYYRTIIGFHILIEKDWIRFGHQFAVRMGQGVNNPTGEEKSPVFFQFLDCVSQLLYQYPTDFQFNYRYLKDMAELSQTNLFGNFLCNCELEMKNYALETKTVSLWSYFLKNKENYLNQYYYQSHPRLQPSTSKKHFRFWKQHFLRYVPDFQEICDIYACKFNEDNLTILCSHMKKSQKTIVQDKSHEKATLDDINKLQTNDQLKEVKEE